MTERRTSLFRNGRNQAVRIPREFEIEGSEVPIHAELPTQEAADLLNVSRPHLVKLLEEGVLPFHKTGKHRRVLFADLMRYRELREEASHAAMEEIAKQAQELCLGNA